VQVTRVLMGSITEPTASDVAEAATLVSTTHEYTSLYIVLLKHFKKSFSNKDAWTKFQLDVMKGIGTI